MLMKRCAGRAGRVPAGLNGCVGIKPTVGKVSTAGVVPAARALDCVSCFARSVPEGAALVRIMQARRPFLNIYIITLLSK